LNRHKWFAVLALSAGCSDPATSEMDPATKPGPSGAACVSGSTLTYETFASDFFAHYCVRCHSSKLEGTGRHGAPASLNYDTFEGVQAVSIDRIDSMAAAGPAQYNAFMPPAEPRPSRAEREQLGQWLACDRP
jgi:hypothetical protein